MARVDRLTVYQTMLTSGLVPLFYHSDPDTAARVLHACVEGGARVLELTNRGEHALEVFTKLRDIVQREDLPILLGVGTVLDAPTAALYIAHGAQFVVGPTFNKSIARLCNRRKIAYIPGCGTTTEISNAEEWGVEIIKVFPGQGLGGPGFIRDLLGPLPWAKLMPSGGVEPRQENIQSWIQAGAACVAMGSQLIRKDYLAEQNYQSIARTVQQVLQWIQEART